MNHLIRGLKQSVSENFTAMQKTKLLILGSTGAVGKHVLSLALNHEKFARIYAPARYSLPQHKKVIFQKINYETLTGDEEFWKVDVVVCCLGTTIKKSGSKEMFFKVDHDYVLKSARHAYSNGCRKFLYVSSVAANSNIKFSNYLKTKGLVEYNLQKIGFDELIILRPPLLDAGRRDDIRFAEEAAVHITKVLRPILPYSLQCVSVEKVAKLLIDHSTKKVSGKMIFGPKEIINSL